MNSESVPKTTSATIARKRSLWSAWLNIIGVALFIGSYFITEDPTNPTSVEKNVIKILFFSGVLSILVSIVLSIQAIKLQEKGLLKYTAILIVVLLILGIVLQPVLMALFGFN